MEQWARSRGKEEGWPQARAHRALHLPGAHQASSSPKDLQNPNPRGVQMQWTP